MSKAKRKVTPSRPKTSRAKTGDADLAGDLGTALIALARGVDHTNELHPLYHLESISDNLGSLAGSLDAAATAIAASVIAQHGSAEDRAKIIEYLKPWFSQGELFRE